MAGTSPAMTALECFGRLPAPLLLVTDRRQAARPLAEILEAAFAAGCRFASIRENDLSEPAQVALAQELSPIAERHGATLVLHGRPEVARAAGLAGVHLRGGSDARPARDLFGPTGLIGVSVHAPAEAARLDPDLVAWAVAGPAFATASKPGYGPPLGPAGVGAVAAVAAVPVLAIGGVTAAAVPDLVAAGAAGVAVMGAVMRAADPGGEIRSLLAALAAAAAPQPRPR
ncbi:thiamine phosphate synthase [Rhodoplanes azumiensis]|uniref:Thiamine phosphate synthase n=1 Tax=Rhodoplanes azumiensis TaxID=1897628 RepID=A0ABW5AFU3_9BRAD